MLEPHQAALIAERVHLELAAGDARRRGDTPEEAARAARIRAIAGATPPTAI